MEKRAQQEAEREQRIQEDQSNLVSDRTIENEKLRGKLKPLGLTVNKIKPNGHCLYRAIEEERLSPLMEKKRKLPFAMLLLTFKS